MAIGAPGGEPGWPVAIRTPRSQRVIRRFALRNRALSGSGVEKGPHILDPRTGHPTTARRAAWSVADSAATADGLSTAFMVMELDAIRQLIARHPETQAVLMAEDDGGQGEIVFLGEDSADSAPSAAGRSFEATRSGLAGGLGT